MTAQTEQAASRLWNLKRGFRILLINEKPDGNFPNHGPDQTKAENLRQLQKNVLRMKADIGIATDGDGDRCTFVDEKGKIMPNDISFLIAALEELKTSGLKKPKILFDLTFSRTVKETLEKTGAKPVIMRVGNPYFKKALHGDKNVLMAGEYSGHIMYQENYGIDDAIYASLKMIRAISKSNQKFSELAAKYHKYYTTGQIYVRSSNPGSVIKNIYAKYSKYKISRIDGASVDMGNAWFNIRASNTEPLVRFIVEGKSREDVEKQRREIMEEIKE